MNVDFHVVIPARLNSTRLPRKLLLDISGQTVIERTYRQALLANPLSVTIATDSEEIAECLTKFGAKTILTSEEHMTGTDRIAEACSKLAYDAKDIIVNVQGDEPFIPPTLISQVANTLACSDVDMATLCVPIDDYATLINPNVVKLVRDKENNALYFSRSAIPHNLKDVKSFADSFKHIGIYAYRVNFLLEFVRLPICNLETIESLEQLRALWYGYKIKVDTALVKPQQEINTKEDLDDARLLLVVV